MSRLFNLSKEVVLYLVFGFLTTAINIIIYWLLYTQVGIHNVISNSLAWVCAVLFMFYGSKFVIFHNGKVRKAEIFKELGFFFIARSFTGAIDISIMYIAVDIYQLDALFWKIVTNVIVIVLNYIASKFYIFKK